MAEQLNPTYYDNTNQASTVSYDQLRQLEGVVEVDNITANGPQHLDVATLQPLHEQGQFILLASANTGGESAVHIWGCRTKIGDIDPRGVFLTSSATDIEFAAQPKNHTAKMMLVAAGKGGASIGRNMPGNTILQLDTDLRVSSRHLHIDFSDKGILSLQDDTSTNGTAIVFKPSKAEGLVADASIEPSAELFEAELQNTSAGQAEISLVPTNTVEQIGATAMQSSGFEAPDIITDGGTQTTQELVVESDVTLQEMYESWSLSEGTTAEQAVQRLQATLQELEQLQSRVSKSSLQDSVASLTRSLHTSIGNGGVYFNQQQVQEASQGIAELSRQLVLLAENGSVVLPNTAKRELDSGRYTIQNLPDMMQQMLPDNMNSQLMDDDIVRTVFIALNNEPIEQVMHQLANTRLQISEKLELLQGTILADTAESDSSTELFADERIMAIAKDLRTQPITKEAVMQATLAIERYIDDALHNQASQLRYPPRIVANSLKSRSYGELAGQKVSSRTVVAEIAVDMLQDKFNFEQTADPISVYSDGKVRDGQHRASALMALYGKSWMNVGKAAGHKIVSV